ncbi:probable serine/threonine-protein kinase PBL22 isoform X2 [Cicer arietinum]|uniref:non-specific serine/threonine protein kinase n=1 Tax=Cicer arietinum TaxID=3827 RepID=A0A1S2XUL9_CICAR|nr:probable receptor-like protein kinase At2g42960 isoform X2 [Cicer arietinum]
MSCHLLFALFIFSIFINSSHLVSPAPNHTQGTCVLDFKAYENEYMQFVECGDVKEDISKWGADGFPTTLCCRNALTLLSEAMASSLHNSSGQLFLSQQQLLNCKTSFQPQQGMSLSSCGFDNIYFGSSKCSSLVLLDVQDLSQYSDVSKCSHFDHSFDESCADCTSTIMSVRDGLYGKVMDKDDNNVTERAICGIAALVAVAAKQQDDPFLADKFLRCLPLTTRYNKKPAIKKVVLGVLVVAILALLIIGFLIKCVSKKKPIKHVQLKQIATWSGLYWFTKTEIENAMNYENEKINLGRGSAGEVFRGVLPSGQVVAIKHLTKSNTSSSDSFTRELAGLSRLRHPNLVCLFGCCMEDGERYLVYEFCASGNLAQHLLRRDSHLTWEARVRILRECSFALKYLHHHIEGCVVHRDIKLTNILLTEKYEAKLSDFGLSKMMGMEESKVFTDVRGTIGYMDPEYMSNAKLTCASDVYSFGIVALQILSGQKVIELDLDARDQLTRKARDVSMGKRPLSDFVDSRLKGQVDKADFGAILQIAVLCVAKSSTGRPSIEVVFDELDKVYRDMEARKKATPTTSTSSSN